MATDRLNRLKPFRWDYDRNTWVVVDNNVSVSTATRTIRILSPELGVRYAVVDLDAWRAHLQACPNAAKGKAPIDLEVVLDETPGIVDHDPTGERFRAASTVLDESAGPDEHAVD